MTTAPAENLPQPIRSRARAAVERAWERAIAAGALPALPDADRPAVEIERPANPEHGDFATNLADAARPAVPAGAARHRAGPRRGARPRVGRPVTAAARSRRPRRRRPGFLNLRLTDRALEETIGHVLAAPGGWGRVRPIRPRRVNVEFVSANPTGPLTIGNARGAFVGDLLCRSSRPAASR